MTVTLLGRRVFADMVKDLREGHPGLPRQALPPVTSVPVREGRGTLERTSRQAQRL